ncbi:hypothetical protein FAZ15_14330 [Sphingobacterium olei]|uniref:Uncharacterized protein n=1 Tax=Sphingobacterium olei TaxID=2571155 RepID=A0A4V5MP62_9SPHI|nr:hypothetical protein [Sphingobacterium olei]TJZ60058.1 hypothetical protein FAZ15_14330 [Sphingobacterium olei]
MILKKEALEQLSKELSLPFTGAEQDWDIEMADSQRINDFLEFYHRRDVSTDNKVAVMSLVLASYEDFLNENDLQTDESWDAINLILESEKAIFIDLINYWSLSNEFEEENIFRITPLIRSIKCN